MKITIVQGAFLPVPPIAGGAVEKLWFDLGIEFAKRGHSVQHISRRWTDLPATGVIDQVCHRRLAGFDYPRNRWLAKWRDLVYSLRCAAAIEASDVIVTNTFFLPLLLSWLPHKGAICVSVHRYPQGQMSMYRRVDRLQCVSTAVAEAVKAQSPRVAPLVKVVPNYVPSLDAEAAIVAAWPARPGVVLFVGRVHPEKGLDLLIAAFAAIPQELRAGWRLRVVGPHEARAGGGGADYLGELKALAAQRGIEVDWAGPVYDREQLNDCYRHASVFVYPSTAALGEAFPLAPLEAMARGCPVVTSDLACFSDYIEPGVNAETFALGAADRSDALRAVLQSLVADAPRRRAIGLAGLRSAGRFTLASVADRFLDDFSALRAP